MKRIYFLISSLLVLFFSLFSVNTQAKKSEHHHVKHKHHYKRHTHRIQRHKHKHRQIHHKHKKAHHKRYKHHKRHTSSTRKYTQVGEASFYGYKDGFAGKRAADGSIFNPMQATVAHRTLPLGSVVRITNLETGKSQMARVTDRGPFYGNRIVDVSYSIAKRLGMVQAGKCKVKIEEMF